MSIRNLKANLGATRKFDEREDPRWAEGPANEFQRHAPLHGASKIGIRKLSNRSGYVLLLSLFAVLFLGIIVGAAFMRSDIEQNYVLQRSEVQEAFYAAEAGLDRTVFELRSNQGWKPGVGGQPAVVNVPIERVANDPTTTIGFYSLEVVDGGIFQNFDTRWVRSIGKSYAIDANGNRIPGTITRVLFARILIENPARFLVSTLGDLRITSGATIDADILGRNMIFEVNSSLPSPANQINVNGDVFYLNSVTGNNNPAVIYGPGAQVSSAPTVGFVGVDTNHFSAVANSLLAQNLSYVGNSSTTVDLDNLAALIGGSATPFQPQIIYVDGDVHIRGEYSHSLLVVANGDVFIEADVVADPMMPVPPQIGILAKRDLIIPSSVVTSGAGDLTIEALVVADGDGASEGVLKTQSAPFSLNTLNFTGSISVRGEGPSAAVDLQAFSNRQYNFNPSLTSNSSIPFNPFIANIIEWREAELTDQFPPP